MILMKISFAQVIDTTKLYTPSGDLAEIDVWNKSKSYQTLLYQKVFWQILPNGKFEFVSKDGFVTVKDGEAVTLDSSTPDNIIEETIDAGYNAVTYIWKHGKRELYTGGLPDGTEEMVSSGKNAGVYVWKDGKKVFKRKINKKDLEEIKKAEKDAMEMNTLPDN